MKQNWWKVLVVVVLVVVVGAVLATKSKTPEKQAEVVPDVTTIATSVDKEAETETSDTTDAKDAKTIEPQKAEAEASKPEAEIKTPEKAVAQQKEENQVAKPAAEKPVKAEVAKADVVEPAPVVKTEEKKASPKKLPKLLELGADKCVPCKMMKPIIDELEVEYKGKLTIEFIDVWKNRGVAEKYGIKSIPTQIFLDENGNEVFRHSGFFAKEDIEAKLAEMGVKK